MYELYGTTKYCIIITIVITNIFSSWSNWFWWVLWACHSSSWCTEYSIEDLQDRFLMSESPSSHLFSFQLLIFHAARNWYMYMYWNIWYDIDINARTGALSCVPLKLDFVCLVVPEDEYYPSMQNLCITSIIALPTLYFSVVVMKAVFKSSLRIFWNKSEARYKSLAKEFYVLQVTHHTEMRGLQLLLMKKETFSDSLALYVWIQRALITAGTAAPLPWIPSIDWHSRGTE